MLSVRSKLYVYISIVLMFPITFLCIFTAYETKKGLEYLVYNQLEIVALTSADRARSKLEMILRAQPELVHLDEVLSSLIDDDLYDTRRSSGEYVYVIDQTGTILVHPSREKKSTGANLFDYPSVTLQNITKSMVAEKRGHGTFYDENGLNYVYFVPYVAGKVYSGSSEIMPVYDLGWSFGAVMPADKVMTVVNMILRTFVIIGCITLITALTAGFLFIKIAIINNINKLIHAMECVTDGEMDVTVNITSHDELGYIGSTFNNMIHELAASKHKLLKQEKLRSELALASKIQTSLIPSDPISKYYEISSTMLPAEDIGGDYYDFIQMADESMWIGIGDVSGHGFKSGLIMMMAQTALTSVIYSNPAISTKNAYIKVNSLLYTNIHERLKESHFMTMVLLHVASSGMVTYTGAHLDIVVYRNATGEIERFKTVGIWSAVLDTIDTKVDEKSFTLNSGDIMVLFTDGLIEAMNSARELYGIDVVCDDILRNHEKTAEELRDIIMHNLFAFMEKQRDDITLIIMRKR